MSDNVPTSPMPVNSDVTTESTRLLDSSAANYNTQDTRQDRTIITIAGSADHQEGSSNGHILNDGSAPHHHTRNIIAAGRPTIPTHQLTEKIQDILIFTEIKKKQQDRAINDGQRSRDKDQQVPVSYDSIDSDSDDDNDNARQTLKNKLRDWSIDGKRSGDDENPLRKRDLAVDALRFATDKWKEKHGWQAEGNSNSSADIFAGNQRANNTTTTVTTALMNNVNGNDAAATTIIQQKQQRDKMLPSSAESVFDVAKNASVCAVLALLHERRQSSGHSPETDISLQSLALNTLNLGLKMHDISASHVVLYEMLTNKWMHGKSALEWAMENNSELILNDARVQLVIEDLWKSGPNWRQDPDHPSNIWLNQPSPPKDSLNNKKPLEEEPKNFAWYVICRTFVDFLARWPSPRYQILIALFSALIYLAFHLATVGNTDYTSENPYAYEYVYYMFVVSDVVLEFYRVWTQPFVYLKKTSSYISIVTVSLLLASFTIRFVALVSFSDIEKEFFYISLSFNLLILATPLMFFRVFATSSDLCWSMAKTSYILHQCFVNSLWVFSIAFFVVVSFWVALSALQFDDINPLAMFQLLIMGALHAPEIGETLFYQPEVAGLLLIVYLFFTVIIFGAILTASFLSTILQIYARIDIVKRNWLINLCLRSGPVLNAFIPSIILDLIFNCCRWVARVVFKQQYRVIWLEKVHQVLWYIVYSPIILLVGLYELITTIMFRWSLVANIFKRRPIVVS